MNSCNRSRLILALSLTLCLHSAFAAEDSHEPHSLALLSAFFGLDNDLPLRANMLCLGASGMDGMPVVLSQTIDEASLQAEDFAVVTRSGETHTPHCVTLRPAQDPGEHRTVLLIGEFGDSAEDPPSSVQVVGDLFASGEALERGNFRGLRVAVIPLAAGPSMILAERVPLGALASDTRGSLCPDGIAQVVRVTWTGGVRLPNREDPGDAQRMLYQVTVVREDGSLHDVVPAALGDLGDGDNNHLLCLDTTDVARSVRFPAGIFVDPNQDLNPETQVAVSKGGHE